MKLFLISLVLFSLTFNVDAKSKRRRHRYSGPTPTHPLLLWVKTLNESQDKEKRKIAAFKLSQYSQSIYQVSAIQTLITCTSDPELDIKVLCTKALGSVISPQWADNIQNKLLERYEADPNLRNTVIRTFIVRKDNTKAVQEKLKQSFDQSTKTEDLISILNYWEQFGDGSEVFVTPLVNKFNATENLKVKRAIAKTLGLKAKAQEKVITTLSKCALEKDTPLALNCLSGLQIQAKNDNRIWEAIENTLKSEDLDVIIASLDVINSLQEKPNAPMTLRLLELMSEDTEGDILEKAILALGICGDNSEAVISKLKELLTQSSNEDSLRIISALILGKQAAKNPGPTQEVLLKCQKEEKTQSVKTACELAYKDLIKRSEKK